VRAFGVTLAMHVREGSVSQTKEAFRTGPRGNSLSARHSNGARCGKQGHSLRFIRRSNKDAELSSETPAYICSTNTSYLII
jgi:hypothetical protein